MPDRLWWPHRGVLPPSTDPKAPEEYEHEEELEEEEDRRAEERWYQENGL